jgi:hypothetical protein
MVKRRLTAVPALRTVREWLFDYFATIDGTKMVEILADVAPREVESFADARCHVNSRIDAMREWLDGTRPSPSPVYELEAFRAWTNTRKQSLKKPMTFSEFVSELHELRRDAHATNDYSAILRYEDLIARLEKAVDVVNARVVHGKKSKSARLRSQ